MYFEVFLEILIAVFAFLGIFCFVKIFGIVFFGYDNILVAVEIDSPDSLQNIEKYVREADMTCLAVGGRDIIVIVKQEYFNENLANELEDKNLKYYVV